MFKVMLAEDDYTMVSLLKTLLGMEGFQVVTLLDKTGGVVENVRKEMPDALLLDVYLGVQNGMDIIRVIRNEIDLKHVHVIMTSGIDVRDKCLEAGADDFLLKPYMPDDLIKKLHACLE